jgi:hypothetical protein
MFIPSWALWVVFVIAVVLLANHVGKQESDYDFVSPFMFVVVIFVGIAFAVGYWLNAWLS